MKTPKRQPSKQTLSVGEEIVEAKREWQNLKKFGNENHLLFGAFIIVLCSILAVNVLYILNRPAEDSAHIKNTLVFVDSPHYVTSNQIARNGAMSASIKNVTENDKKDMAFTIDPSETMLILEVTVTNNTTETQHLLPSIQFYGLPQGWIRPQIHPIEIESGVHIHGLRWPAVLHLRSLLLCTLP